MEGEPGPGRHLSDAHVGADKPCVVVVLEHALVHQSVQERLETRVPVGRVAAPAVLVEHAYDVGPVKLRHAARGEEDGDAA